MRYHVARAYAALERDDQPKVQFARAAELSGDDNPLGEQIGQAPEDASKAKLLN